MTVKLGIIARADDTGLGIQSWEAARHLEPHKVMVVDLCHLSPKKLSLHPQRFPGATVVTGIPTAEDIHDFLDGLDVVLTFETPYNHTLFTAARERGVKTVLQSNPEFYDYALRPELPRPDLFAMPTGWLYDGIAEPKCLLPVPVALGRFPLPPVRREGMIVRFLHIVGHPAAHDRAGTKVLLAALPLLTQPATVTLRCQDPCHLHTLLREAGIVYGTPLGRHKTVDLRVGTLPLDHYWELYPAHDVLVHPRRYGGLNLPAQEALAASMPVIMPDVSPNTELLPSDWLVPAKAHGHFDTPGGRIELQAVRPAELAAKMDDFAASTREPNGFLPSAQRQARTLAEERSWGALLPLYQRVFTDLVM